MAIGMQFLIYLRLHPDMRSFSTRIRLQLNILNPSAIEPSESSTDLSEMVYLRTKKEDVLVEQ